MDARGPSTNNAYFLLARGRRTSSGCSFAVQQGGLIELGGVGGDAGLNGAFERGWWWLELVLWWCWWQPCCVSSGGEAEEEEEEDAEESCLSHDLVHYFSTVVLF